MNLAVFYPNDSVTNNNNDDLSSVMTCGLGLGFAPVDYGSRRESSEYVVEYGGEEGERGKGGGRGKRVKGDKGERSKAYIS